MKTVSIACLLALIVSLSVKAQRQDFTSNIIKIQGNMFSGYGFITATDRSEKSAHFIRITKDSRHLDELTVITQGGKSTMSATLVRPVLSKGGYNILVYRLSNFVPAELKYFRSTSAKASKYYGFGDLRRDAPRALAAKLSRRDLTVEQLGGKNLLTQAISFETGDKGTFGLGSTPIVDADGVITAVAAEDQEEDKSFFEALDISTLQQLLEDMGTKAGSPCRYFNLIPQGAYRDENTCQKLVRLQQEEARRVEEAKELRAKELKQENLKRIVELYETGNREREVRKIYNKSRDRRFGMSIGGSAFFSVQSFKKSSEMKNNENIGPSSGYSFGANLYYNIDGRPVRFVLKPRFSFIELGYTEKYTYNAAIDFKLSSTSYKAFELPVAIDLVFNRRESGDNFLSFGYGLAKHISNELTYTTDGIKTKESVIGYRKMSQHALVELGLSKGRFRGGLFAKYQITPYARSNYEIIVDRKPVYPFEILSNHYWAFGVDMQMRLWNRWNNDYRTIKMIN